MYENGSQAHWVNAFSVHRSGERVTQNGPRFLFISFLASDGTKDAYRVLRAPLCSNFRVSRFSPVKSRQRKTTVPENASVQYEK
jgi:hypothetical protein